MALRVWLPLNGNLNNQGLSNYSFNNVDATVDTNGKIGKTYSFNGTSSRIYTNNVSLNSSVFTVSAWVKLASVPTSGTWYVISLSQGTGGGADQQTCLYFNATGVGFGAGGVTTNFDYTFEANKWYHLAMTCDNASKYLFINGTQVKTGTIGTVIGEYLTIGARNNSTSGAGAGASYFFNGTINDVRIYDECLSDKQIKEISKGLVAHYKMGNQYETTLQNIYDETYSCGNTSQSSWTKTKLENERGYNYKMTYTGTGSDSWPNMHCPTFAFTIGKRYYYSVKVRCHKWTGGSLALRAARCTNDWVASSIVVCSSSLADGKWHEYKVSTIIPESFDRSGTTMTSAPCFEFYTSSLATEGFVYDMDFDLKDIQVVESDEYVPFINNNCKANYIADSSGYGYNGTIGGTLVTSSDSARYNTSVLFNSGYLHRLTSPINANTDAFSYSLWFKPTQNLTMALYNDRKSVGDGFSLFYLSGSLRFDTGSSYQYQASAAVPVLNAWNHIVITWSKTNGKKVYLNGELKNSTATAGTLANIGTYASIGNSSTDGAAGAGNQVYGNLSDIRLYCTELSASDVLTLYKTSGIIDNNENMYSYEFIEED